MWKGRHVLGASALAATLVVSVGTAPDNAQEVLDLGRHAYELSRYSGCWTGLKIVTSVADGFGSAEVAPGRITPVLPELSFGGEPWRHAQRPSFFLPHTIELEAELYERRHAAAADRHLRRPHADDHLGPDRAPVRPDVDHGLPDPHRGR